MRSNLKSGLLVGLVVMMAAGAAQARTYECDFAEIQMDGGWITPKYVIVHDEAAGTATAVDALIDHYEGKPVAAEVLEDSDGKVVFRWKLHIRDASGQQAVMVYRAVWFKGPGFMRITATPQGYANMFEAEGACKIG